MSEADNPDRNLPIENKLYRVPDDLLPEIFQALTARQKLPTANRIMVLRALQAFRQPYSTTSSSQKTIEEAPTPKSTTNVDAVKQAQLGNAIEAFKGSLQNALNSAKTKPTKDMIEHLISSYQALIEPLKD